MLTTISHFVEPTFIELVGTNLPTDIEGVLSEIAVYADRDDEQALRVERAIEEMRRALRCRLDAAAINGAAGLWRGAVLPAYASLRGIENRRLAEGASSCAIMSPTHRWPCS